MGIPGQEAMHRARPDEASFLDLTILVEDPQWHRLAEGGAPLDVEAVLRRALAAVLHSVPLPPGLTDRGCEAALLLTDDAAIQVLNRTWRGIDKPTDVLSFPGDDGFVPQSEPLPLGDIVLARETVLRDARAMDRRLAHHLSHMAVHGMLHLLGWDHEIAADAERMEAQEEAVLRGLGYAGGEGGETNGGAGPAAGEPSGSMRGE